MWRCLASQQHETKGWPFCRGGVLTTPCMAAINLEGPGEDGFGPNKSLAVSPPTKALAPDVQKKSFRAELPCS